MMMLTDIRDESIIIILENGTEIEIEIIEFEQDNFKVLIYAGKSVSIERNSDNT